MKWNRIGAGIGVIVLSNAVVLSGVAFNQTGEPEAEITLTERELLLPHKAFRNEENTGLHLRVSLNRTGYRWPSLRLKQRDGTSWFDQEKLKAIGYDCSIALSDPNAKLYYSKALPRETYVVLEYGGKTWSDLLKSWSQDIAFLTQRVENGEDSQKNLKRLTKAYQNLQKRASRLLAIDVGNDPHQLRKRYADSHHFLIVRGLVELRFVNSEKTKSEEHHPPYLKGRIVRLLIDQINVPLSHGEELENLFNLAVSKERVSSGAVNYLNESKKPEYEVTLRYGKRYEPWIIAIRPR